MQKLGAQVSRQAEFRQRSVTEFELRPGHSSIHSFPRKFLGRTAVVPPEMRQSPRMNPKTIRVQGKGSVSQAPDRIRLSFTLTGNDRDFTVAVEGCNNEIKAVRASAKSCGIDPSELKTTHFDVREETEYDHG